MKYLALAVLFAIMQAVPPIPRKAPNAHTTGGNHIQENTAAKQEPAHVPVAIEKADSTNPDKNSGSSPSKSDDHVTVIVQPPTSTSGWEIAYVIFTGLLVAIGAGGVGAAFYTLKQIRRQANLMAEQREVMQGQMRTMQGQMTEMSVQSETLKESVDVARDTAKAAQDGASAAKESANAARDSVELVVNKERARIRIGTPESPILIKGGPARIEFRLFFYGTTPAFDVNSNVITVLSESLDSFDKATWEHGIYELPKVATATDFAATFRDHLLRPLPLDESTIERINKGELHIHFSGLIKYLDFFDKPRETAFHFRWKASDKSANSLRRLVFPEGWQEVGGEKENYYT